MAKVAQYCINAETTVAAKILKLYAALGTSVVILLFDFYVKICQDLFSSPSVSLYLPENL
jgi:hypothetical protein